MIDLEEEIKNCCPLCGGIITNPLEDFLEVEAIYREFIEQDYYKKDKLKGAIKFLKIKLKMIEMGLMK